MLLPKTFPMERDCFSFQAAMMDVVSSGMDVPSATMLRPMKAVVTASCVAICTELSTNWIEDGSAVEAMLRKRAEAEARQLLAMEILGRFGHLTHPRSFYFWLELSQDWTSADFRRIAATRSIWSSVRMPRFAM